MLQLVFTFWNKMLLWIMLSYPVHREAFPSSTLLNYHTKGCKVGNGMWACGIWTRAQAIYWLADFIDRYWLISDILYQRMHLPICADMKTLEISSTVVVEPLNKAHPCKHSQHKQFYIMFCVKDSSSSPYTLLVPLAHALNAVSVAWSIAGRWAANQETPVSVLF